MEGCQTLVAGAGAVGLATAAALARRGRSVLIAERERAIGTGVSSRSSEVIHTGLYYPAGSRKARLCVRGNALLYAYCESRGVPAKRTGKLLVATSAEQLARSLPDLQTRARANGVRGLRVLSREEACALEPEVECMGALLSESSGIVDSHGFMLALLADAERDGATLALNTTAVAAHLAPSGRTAVELHTSGAGEAAGSGGDDDHLLLECDEVINCAGLSAVRLGRALGASDGGCASLNATFARGSYFALRGGVRSPFSRLVYPLPDADLAGLGVHATLDLAGRVRFGPDVEWLGDDGSPRLHPDDDSGAFRVDESRADSFYAAIRRYWPALPDESLVADYAGIRPKLSRPGEPPADFAIIQDGQERPGLWHLAGIESPGLTSCLALADEVAHIVTGGVPPARPWVDG
jgi:L-2-hydroxyglutarate oxidase LhgO